MSTMRAGQWVWVDDKDGGRGSRVAGRVRSVNSETGEVVVEPFWGELCDTCCALPAFTRPGARPKLMTIPRRGPKSVLMMSQSNVEGRADMMELADLNVGELMHNLRLRYKAKPMDYYTWVGDILVVLNPMGPTGLADMSHMARYAGTSFKDPALDPHIFAVAERAYASVCKTSAPQTIVISGESGAGKTVSTRHCLDYLAFRSGQAGGSNGSGSGSGSGAGAAAAAAAGSSGSESLSRLGAASEVLEALGNSKTLRNHNSSRFGKFVKIYFDSVEVGVIKGAYIQTYLLEKSRIVDQDDGERNYHIFYLMLQFLGDDVRRSLGLSLGPVESYAYLVNARGSNAASWRVQPDAAGSPMEDDVRWADLTAAIDTLGLGSVFEDVWRMCGAVLSLGNIKFREPDGEDGTTSTMCSIVNPEEVAAAAELLDVSPDSLTEVLLSCRVVSERRAYTASKAKANVDALAKSIYSHMFDYVVEAINKSLAMGAPLPRTRAWIGVLDIFGFESFQDEPDAKGRVSTRNTFEQLCINLTNERLQRFFYDELIPKQIAHYQAEGIDVDAIQYDDNALAVDAMMEGKFSLFALLDDATRTAMSHPKYRDNPSDGDNLWVSRISEAYPGSKNNFALTERACEADFVGWYDDPLDDRSGSTFCVHHYAGTVWYSTSGAVDRNSDTLALDCVELMAGSGTAWLAAGYDPSGSANDRASVARVFARQLRQLVCPPSWKSAASSGGGGELDASATPLFVRCVKPICRKQPGNTHGWLEDHKVLDQLNSAGIYAVIQMRQSGYATEMDKAEFLDMYWELEEDVKTLMDLRTEDEQIHHLARIITSDPTIVLGDLRGMAPYQVGRTRVFLKESMASAMATALRVIQDTKLARMEAAGLHLKALARMALVVRDLPRLREAAAERHQYLRRRRAFIAQGLTPEQADEAIRREDEEAAAREEERFIRKHYTPLADKVNEARVPELIHEMQVSAREEASPTHEADITDRVFKLTRLLGMVRDTLAAYRADVHSDDAHAAAVGAVNKLRKRVKKEEAALQADRERRAAEARAAAEAERRVTVFEPAVAELVDVGADTVIASLDEFARAFAPVIEAGKIDGDHLQQRRDRLAHNLGRAKAAFSAWDGDVFNERRERKARAWVTRLRKLLDHEDGLMQGDLVEVARYTKVTQMRAKLAAAQKAKRAKLRERRNALLAAQKAEADRAARAAAEVARAQAKAGRAKARAKRKRTRQLTRFMHKLRVSAMALDEAGIRVLYQNMECAVRYVGPITFNLAKRDADYDVRGDPTMVGLETPVGKHSYNSGSAAGVKYFKCYPQHGVFVAPSKLCVIDPPRRRGRPIGEGDVVWHTESRFLRTGRVLFVGHTHFSEDVPVVGVELEQDDALGNTDGTVDGVRYFDVEFSRGMFFPVPECRRIDAWNADEIGGIIADYCAIQDIDIESESGHMSDSEVEELLFDSTGADGLGASDLPLEAATDFDSASMMGAVSALHAEPSLPSSCSSDLGAALYAVPDAPPAIPPAVLDHMPSTRSLALSQDFAEFQASQRAFTESDNLDSLLS